jgi:hypothetical protein
MRPLSDSELVRLLELTAVIAGLKPRVSLALLPPDRREAALADGWRAALAACPKTIAELSGILNR